MDNNLEFKASDYLDFVFFEDTYQTRRMMNLQEYNEEVNQTIIAFFRLKRKYQTREAFESYIQERVKVVAYNFAKKVVIEHENYLAQNN